jgi:hypothetical protein
MISVENKTHDILAWHLRELLAENVLELGQGFQVLALAVILDNAELKGWNAILFFLHFKGLGFSENQLKSSVKVKPRRLRLLHRHGADYSIGVGIEVTGVWCFDWR